MTTKSIYKTTSAVNAAAAIVNGYCFFAFDNEALIDIFFLVAALLTAAACGIYWWLGSEA